MAEQRWPGPVVASWPWCACVALRGYAPALAATLLLGILSAGCSSAGTTMLCGSEAVFVSGGVYGLQNNEWGSSAPECITTDGGANFTVVNSAIAKTVHGAPGGYPFIYKGCHWGSCTRDSGFPVQVADIGPGTVTTSWSTTQPGGSNVYNVAYDIWFNQTPTTNGLPNGGELMIWLNHEGRVHPAGFLLASNVIIGGRTYDVWGRPPGARKTISYTMTSGVTSVSDLDLQPLVADAVSRDYLRSSWYLIAVEAGFEIWQGGVGLAVSSFSAGVVGGG